VATTIVAAKTIEETAEAEPGPTLRGQLAVASPVVLPNSAACCSPRRTRDGCGCRHQPTPSRSPAASTATCSLLHLQAVTPFQRSGSWQKTRRRYQRATPRSLVVVLRYPCLVSSVTATEGGGIFKSEWGQIWEGTHFPVVDLVVASLDSAFTESRRTIPRH